MLQYEDCNRLILSGSDFRDHRQFRVWVHEEAHEDIVSGHLLMS